MKVETAIRIKGVQEYYFSRKLSELAGMQAQGRDIINLGVGSPDLAPPRSVIDQLQRSSNNPQHHGYQGYRGIAELRLAWSKWYQEKFAVVLDPDLEILPLIGSKEGIMHISMTYLDVGDLVLIPNPGYPTYRAAASLAGASCQSYNLNQANGWFPDLAELDGAGSNRAKLMWINYPHMPSGAKATKQQFNQLIAWAINNQILLCHDNPYAFIRNPNPLSVFQNANAKSCCIELTSLSKTYNMAGWRVGALSGPAECINDVLKFKSNMDSGMFKPIQQAAIEALQQPDEYYQSLNEIYSGRAQIAQQLGDQLACTAPSGQVGMFLWLRIPDQWTSAYDYSDHILEQTDVFITPGGIFGDAGDRYLRISLCSPETVLSLALERCEAVRHNLSIK